MKKNSKKSVENVENAVMNTLMESAKSTELAFDAALTDTQAQRIAVAEAEGRTMKYVDFTCNTNIISEGTEKASLFTIISNTGQQLKIWVAKSKLHTVVDGDYPEKTKCTVPAWLYFRSALKEHFTIEHWSTQVI